jgi:hypothetical protein
MDQGLRKQRLWQLLERFSRALLYRIGRAARGSIGIAPRKHDVLEALCALPEAALERALVEGLARQDLQALCRRTGYASTGSKADLAARLLAAVDEPTAQLTRWRPFAEARAFAQRLELSGHKQWYEFVHDRLPAKGARPTDIPKYPNLVYAKTGWTSWSDFLGTGNPRRGGFRPFRQARAYARSLGLASRAEWYALARARIGNRRTLPPDIPASPDRAYAGRGWVSYRNWLGTEGLSPSRYRYRSYAEACAFVRGLGIRTVSEWRAYCHGKQDSRDPRPHDISTTPSLTYRGRGWISWGHFFGTNAVSTSKRTFRAFAVARAYARKLGLRSHRAWISWCAAGKRPADIPAAPYKIYRGRGWASWADFLGTSNLAPSRVRRRSFAAMRALVRQLSLPTGAEFVRAKRDGRIPKDIPTKIDQHPEWKGWADFLGPSYTGRRPRPRPTRTHGRRG